MLKRISGNSAINFVLLILTSPFALSFSENNAVSQDFIYHDDFNDGELKSPGRWYKYEGPGTADATTGDFVIESPSAWSMWSLSHIDDERLRPRSEWSFRAKINMEDVFLAIGTNVYHHAGLWEENGESILRAGTGGNGPRSTTIVPYPLVEEDLFLQMDSFDGDITASVWKEGDPDSLIQHSHFYDPVNVRPSFGVNGGSATFYEIWISTSPLPITFLDGDFNADGVLDADDIDSLADAMGTADSTFDLNEDGVIDFQDHSVWVHDVKGTWYGDANLDGEFSSLDLVVIFQTGKFETDEAASWSDGDWNGDKVFSTSDLVTAFQDSGYEQGQRQAVAAVPEPSSVIALMMAFLGLILRRRRI